MKVGMIFECGPQGADKSVCEHLALRLDSKLEIKRVTLSDKQNLLSECGQAAAGLVEEGYERIVIVWDLYPPWRETEPCRKEDRETIIESLKNAGVSLRHAHLVCVIEELEAWLLADERALNGILSRPTHPVSVRRVKRTERVNNPKKRLNRIFQQHSHRPYSDLTDAERIVKALPDLNRIRHCETFARFAVKVTGKNVKEIVW